MVLINKVASLTKGASRIANRGYSRTAKVNTLLYPFDIFCVEANGPFDYSISIGKACGFPDKDLQHIPVGQDLFHFHRERFHH